MTNKPVLENDYIRGIITGDSQLLKELYEKYHKAILQLVEIEHGNSEDAKDVFQEAIMLVFQKAQQSHFKLTSSFFTYFYSICHNIWRNKRRKKVNSELTLTDDKILMLKDLSLPEIEANEQYILYRKKFILLGEDCQKLLRMFFQKIKMEEIKVRLNYSSVNYVKQRKFKCKAQLIKLIEKDPAYNELKY